MMNIFLILAGTFNALAAIMHLGCIYFGAPWYRFFGAGEEMARMAEKGSIKPTLITLVIVFVLVTWAVFAYSAAGLFVRLPLTQYVLMAISLIYAIRGLSGFFFIKNPMGRAPQFWFWSSCICLVGAVLHVLGLYQQWLYV